MRSKVIAALAVGVMAATSACGGATTDSGGDKVNIAINPWTGYEASAAVIQYLLENELDVEVDTKELKEENAWQGFEREGDDGVDVIVEDWQHTDLRKKYIDDKKVAVNAGTTGNKGLIGWYVPTWMLKKYPGIDEWKNLNKYAKDLETSESKGKGQLLFGDKSYVSNEEALIDNLGLDYEVVVGGSENALIEAAQQSEKQQEPLLFYFWDPHWLFEDVELTRVKLPEYSDDTTQCPTDPKKVKCDYPEMDLETIVSKDFADNGGDAYKLVKNFEWTNEDQNSVALDILKNDMKPEEAAEKWVNANKDVWKKWLP
ncbi:ABC transporter substrate-binding protein [Stackebrandtia nassauensis]|uniref:Substrate-binding region of ABC-type glycine betaine transport system n=1 Tax=Stackebrandtia nassauensis (strain DSM 44728 / CIP 108903 / NRRL B-16338 / NBRC 102104 / LLR-40K-21) TaxID=446470 RepID=D3Q4P9_STANL|nr:ABC transporter substrate-binding protein [Stackebrandtia nassauensis]ADD42079.1 Substrate-binding region of ABC-type glycine betaine transport system [Stackebrandtia nassauensis DSM 44728]